MWVYGNQLCCVGTIKTLRYRLLNRPIYPPRLIVMDVSVCLRAESCSPDWLVFPVLGGRIHWEATLWCHVTRAKRVCLICEFGTDACVMGPQVRDCLHSTTIGAYG